MFIAFANNCFAMWQKLNVSVTLDRCLLSTELVSRGSQSNVNANWLIELNWIINISDLAQVFPVVAPYKKSVFGRTYLKASQCHPKLLQSLL